MASADNGLSFRSFAGLSGRNEHYIVIEAPADLRLSRQIDTIAHRYTEALQTLRLAPDTAVFRRLYLSDAANQTTLLRQGSLFREPFDSPFAVSMVQQPPLPGAKVAMLAYHLDGGTPIIRHQLSPEHLLLEHDGLGHLFSTGLCAGNSTEPISTADQTRSVFERLIGTLQANGATLADHCVRTWLYIKDVDFFYQEMVDARTALFERHGLTRDTHYIASTGIEGSCSHRYDTVLMDAYSVLGLQPNQISYLNDFDRLCATKDYNVTFERGTCVAYADRAHHFISGTASIDPAGQVVHRGDVYRQLEHALENVDALLRSGGAELDDMTHFIVYLRDPSDHPSIRDYFSERFPDVPALIVRGAVCRPDWLVEVEGIAVAPHEDSTLPAY